ncbi:glycoside hydrolase family 27 protein [Silvibacterium acidisoli]|uniref:glycoside hydrolase family 27 protein n=1 Tax=Acidobacteriaceae bacterium ZG23-2 TaxID=2883246 RepID=UPI00406C6753
MKLTSLLAGCVVLGLQAFCMGAQAQGVLAPTPPMGWNSWNHFAEKVTDKDVRAAADAMVASGMRDAGYVYVNIDDGWQGKRDAAGNIQANERFPDMKALADYVHGKGLKLGIYTSPGAHTCAGFEGSLGHEKQDAAMYAKWGVDYLKYDLCSYTENLKQRAGNDHAKSQAVMEEVYRTMHDALASTGRPIVLSLCQYGWEAVWRWGAETGGSLWRTTGDIEDNYASMERIGFSQAGLAKFAGPGRWNDPDMLEVGNGGMNSEEYRSHMTLWAMLAAPLLAGNDLSKMTDDTKSILMNREVIAVDQDAAGHQGDRVYTEGPLEVWSKPLADGSVAVAIFSRWRMPLDFDVPMTKLGFGENEAVKARDLWAHQDLPEIRGAFHTKLKPHSVVLLRLSR